MVRDAVFGDAAARLVDARLTVPLVLALTAFYVAICALLPSADIAVPFAIVPLSVAAFLLRARWSLAVALMTYVTVLVYERLFDGVSGLRPLEIFELGIFGLVSLGLRIAVTRLVLDSEALDRQGVELASTQAQVAEARDATERWVAQLEAVQRAAARMSGQPTVEAVADAVADETGAIIDYHNCRVYLVEPNDEMTPIIAAGQIGTYESIPLDLLRTQVGAGFSGWVAEHGTPLLIPDANADPRGSTIPGTDDVEESMLVVPMRYDDRVIGVIALSKLGLRQFDVGDLRLLSILADHAATAVESARALSRAHVLADELRALAEMSSALSESLDPLEVADLVARHVGRAAGVDQCSISLWDRAGDRLLTSGYWPPERLAEQQPFFPLSGYPATRHVLDSQEAVEVNVDDPAADPAEVALLRHDGHHGVVMLPLVVKGEALGLVELFIDRPIALPERRLDLAQMMATEAAMALGNAQAYVTARALADRDPLTGFFNHRYLHERLAEEILRAQRSREPLAVLMLDLDDFKLVNDTLGHLFGDEILRWTAAQIRAGIRASDVPTRYGGDEFAVILPATTAAEALRVGDRILAALAENPYTAPDHGPIPVTASIGTATFPGQGRTPRELIAVADAALYRVKAGGGAAVAGVPALTGVPALAGNMAMGRARAAGDPAAASGSPAATGGEAGRPRAARGSGGHSAPVPDPV